MLLDSRALACLALGGFLLAGCGGGTRSTSTTGGPAPGPAAGAAPVTQAGYEEIEVSDGGTIEGKVIVEGAAPPMKKIRVARPSDQTVCGSEKDSHLLRVDPSGGVRDAIVTLPEIRRGKPLAALPAAVPVDQQECQYVPHVAIVPAGSQLDLVNSDPLLHNVHAYLPGGETLFNAAMPRRGMKLAKRLPESGWVSLKCDVHPWMSGTVWVTEHPYTVPTDSSGAFRLTGVPAGRHVVRAWHPALGEISQDVEVTPGGTAAVTLRLGGASAGS
jgi:plastocyanin